MIYQSSLQKQIIFTVPIKSYSFTAGQISSNKYLKTENKTNLHYKDKEVNAVKEIIIVYSENYMKRSQNQWTHSVN